MAARQVIASGKQKNIWQHVRLFKKTFFWKSCRLRLDLFVDVDHLSTVSHRCISFETNNDRLIVCDLAISETLNMYEHICGVCVGIVSWYMHYIANSKPFRILRSPSSLLSPNWTSLLRAAVQFRGENGSSSESCSDGTFVGSVCMCVFRSSDQCVCKDSLIRSMLRRS